MWGGTRTAGLRFFVLFAAIVLAALSLAASATAALAGAAQSVAGADRSLASAVAARVNALRASRALHLLGRSAELDRAAQEHALDMAQRGYFSHSSADGTGPTRRITAFYTVDGAIRWSVGEVMLWTVGTVSAEDAVTRWLASHPHRRELLRRGWRDVGISAIHAEHAPGVFGDRTVTLVVVDFGRRS